MLAHHERGFRDTDTRWRHDFIGLRILQHPVLMNAALMRKRVPADNRFVVLHREGCNSRDELGGPRQQGRLDPRSIGQHIAARLDRHHDFFQSRIARALAEPVDRALDLPRATLEPGKRIRHRKPQIIMAMHREDRLVRIRNSLTHLPEHVAIFVRRRIPHRIRQVDRRRTRLDRSVHTAAQIFNRRARRIHGRPLDIRHKPARTRHRCRNNRQHLFLGLLHLEFEMDRRGRDKGMDARLGGVLHSLACPVDIGIDGAGKPRHRCALDPLGNLRDSLEVTIRGDREPRLDNVDAHEIQQIGYFELFLERHGRAGRLLAIAQRGVKNNNAVFI